MDGVRVDRFVRRMEQQTVEFSHFLRGKGFPTTVDETQSALQLFAGTETQSAQDLLSLWRPIFAKTAKQWEDFPDWFNRFFYPDRTRLRVGLHVQEVPKNLSLPSERTSVQNQLTASSRALFAYSPRWGTLGKLAPGSDIPYHQMRRWTRYIARYWAYPERWRGIASQGRILNWRGTVRAAFRYGGDPLKWQWLRRSQEHLRLVVLVDVSGSMQAYVPFYLGLVWQLMREGARTECFLSSNQVKRNTPFLRHSGPGGAVVADAQELGGGTRLGWAFSWLLHKYPNLCTRRTTVLICSDGFDTGDLSLLAESFPVLIRQSERVVWLNPLLLLPDYSPVSAALKIVLSYGPEHVGVADSASWIHYVRSCI